MKVAIGSDHAGFRLKEFLKERLKKEGYELIDAGCYSENSVDYPDYALKVSEMVTRGDCSFGILICGTGLGMSIAANKIKGIRAAACSNLFEAMMARRHNDANVICIGSRVVGDEHALCMVTYFLKERFEGGRHERRIKKILELEKGEVKGER